MIGPEGSPAAVRKDLERLRRTRSGDLDISKAHQVADLMEMDPGKLSDIVMPVKSFERGGQVV